MGHAGGLFDLVAKIAGLPGERHLCRYTVSNSNDPDGMMHGNVKRAHSVYIQKILEQEDLTLAVIQLLLWTQYTPKADLE